MQLTPNYYNDRVCLNVLANSIDNAKAVYEAAQTHVVVGILSKNYCDNQSAITDMKKYAQAIDNAISIGLGAGDPNQSDMVSQLAAVLQPQHVNQVFTGVGASRALLGQKETVINGLVSPTGRIGLVNIATGPLSSKTMTGVVPIETAIALLKDMGGSSIKFFPMGGLKHRAEFEYVAKCCAEQDFYLEPTGGIDLDNYEVILKIALDAGVKRIIPHIYSSIINQATGETRTADVEKLLAITQKLVG
ncbi:MULTISPECIES: 2-dehydro-3-deoxy-phosphogluconate aldolase [unclassified Gilliamella]|uniref:2-dehydro-3-deoxy-phosphogluconate aldolase n=1 Tax=unclassified Gilliamella TaxID=2685620 RepID=UPI00226A7373|nr:MULTISPECIES: KDGP aldolase family protein [unclassified Gilliamella]MCX8642860.1 KDGP aldolase family protein [Gilliamella sp. B3835]MCX8708181.1 KDGP aldolase family protein [Gilliamella sp. B3783]MCX8710079.1 KDGP aldolase family protein [Gilliamella sp. B3780]MCX8715355.1 KDGP aldolase family protein [Gilliamella sp. B3781]MCX8717376.1 KDGP aldolase family protein [Gilliamella sp. B3784]